MKHSNILFNAYEINNNQLVLNVVKKEKEINKKIHHIVIIDNIELGVNTKYITNEYAYMLERYMKHVDLDIYLMHTYPKYDIKHIDNNLLYSEFRKIVYSNLGLICDGDHYLKILSQCSNTCNHIRDNDNGSIIELILFTDIRRIMSQECIILFNKLVDDNINISIITNSIGPVSTVNTISDKISKYTLKDYGAINMCDFLKKLVSEGLFLLEDINKEDIIKLNINDPTISFLGFNDNNILIDLNKYNSFIVTINKQLNELNIVCDDTNYNVQINKDNIDIILMDIILMGINTTIDKITNTTDTVVCEQLKYMLQNLMKNRLVENINAKTVYIYNKLKNALDTIRKSILDNTEETNIFIKYTKKINTDPKLNKHKNKTNELFMRNKKQISFFDNINDIYKKPHIQKFIEKYDVDSCNESCDEKFVESTEFFSSNVTLSNWFDELSQKGVIGLLVKVSSSELAKIGICHNVSVDNITTTFYPIIDFLEQSINYFNKNTYVTFGDINNKNIISGDAIGDGNSVIPLYINKYHWEVAKYYMNPMLGIIFSHNPYSFSKNHHKFVFRIFAHMMTYTLLKNDTLNERWVRCYIAMFRTCAELSFEYKYNYGIKKYVNEYMNNPKKRIVNELIDMESMITQCITTGYFMDIDKMKLFIRYRVEDIIRSYLRKNKYGNQYINYIKGLVGDDDMIKSELLNIVNDIDTFYKYELNLMVSFYYMSIIINDIIKEVGSYNKFINILEQHFGVLPKNLLDIFLEKQKYVNEKIQSIIPFTVKNIYKHFEMEYDENEMIFHILQNLYMSKPNDKVFMIDNNKYIDYIKQKEEAFQFLKQYILNL